MKKQVMIMVVLVALAAALIVGVFALTEGRREANEQAALEAAMREVLPGGETFTEEEQETEDIETVWRSENGWVIETETDGYVDEIRLLVGVNEAGEVVGVKVYEQHESAGLGTETATARGFLEQFLGVKGGWTAADGFDALSGATVSSKAVAKGVSAAAAYVTGADVSSGATEWGG